jgi:glycosyltransferase involved in cell wall biosynthesis/LmbE family N-acetylglucosaminyl deacetylase
VNAIFSALRETLLTRSPVPALSVLIIAAHPDDEIIGASTIIRHVPNQILHTTDGSPENLADAIAAGCSSRVEYAALRRRELLNALALAGCASIPLHQLGFQDQTCSFHLRQLTERVRQLIQRLRPNVVITHPYEGGHPDHDATAFAVHTAVRSLSAPPLIVEMTSYHLGPSGITTGEFLPSDNTESFIIELTAEERALKQAMFKCFQSQRQTLQYFQLSHERFRVAPHYDFSAAPHAGKLFYEQFAWGVTGQSWRDLAQTAFDELSRNSSPPGVPSSRLLTVLNVAYPFAPVGPNAVGGAEQVLTQLDHALVAAGFNSLILACAGSKTYGKLFPHAVPSGPLDSAARAPVHLSYKAAIERIIKEYDVDVIHMHGIDFASYLPQTDLPILVTLHLPLDWYAPEFLSVSNRRVYFNCVSASQRTRCSMAGNFLPDIPNGIPVDLFTTKVRKRRVVSALGRICPEKGFHHALDAAKLAEIPMFLAGHVFRYPEHQTYFASEIRPRLSDSRRFIGSVGFFAKRRLLAASRCVLVPSLAPETSSLVAMEALACGTPVIAFRSGALPDIVEHGITGFIVENEREMARAIRAIDQIQPGICRARARERFSAESMTGRYLEVYRQLSADSSETPQVDASFEPRFAAA